MALRKKSTRYIKLKLCSPLELYSKVNLQGFHANPCVARPPGNLATAMRVSIDIAVQHCEVRKVMQVMQPASVHLAHHHSSLVCWCVIHVCSHIVARAHSRVHAGHWHPLSGSDGGLISCRVGALMPWGSSVFLWGVSGWVVHVLRCFGEVVPYLYPAWVQKLMKITMKACRYDAPSLAVLKIHFAKIITKFFLSTLRHPSLPYLRSRLAFPVPPCMNPQLHSLWAKWLGCFQKAQVIHRIISCRWYQFLILGPRGGWKEIWRQGWG